jgi:ubiquitin C-terminal hydrolase
MALCRLPPVLTIHLKRFAYTATHHGKITSPVRFELEITQEARSYDFITCSEVLLALYS